MHTPLDLGFQNIYNIFLPQRNRIVSSAMLLLSQRIIILACFVGKNVAQSLISNNGLLRCGEDVSDRLHQNLLSVEDKKFCEWATSSNGGGATPGISWGNLKDAIKRKHFIDAGCSLVQKNITPTCSKLQGDEFLLNWRYHSRNTI